jgi:hypothetical protein
MRVCRGNLDGDRTQDRRAKAGTRNKATAAKAAAIEASGLTPLAYLLSLMRDESLDPMTRMEAAKAAAPYVHPRLSASEPPRGDVVPLHERLKAYARRDAIEASEGKVVKLKH